MRRDAPYRYAGLPSIPPIAPDEPIEFDQCRSRSHVAATRSALHMTIRGTVAPRLRVGSLPRIGDARVGMGG